MPLVSVITPLFNKGDFVGETLRSVQAQSVKDWEMIVVENGSTDNGPSIVRACDDARVRLVTSPRRGPGAARNFGLGLATGGWVLFLDADDLIGSRYFEQKLACAKENPGAQVVAGKWVEFDQGDSAQGQQRQPAGFGRSASEVVEQAIGFAPWAVHAALVNREWLMNRMWFEELDGSPSEDTAFWFRVLQGAAIAWSEDSEAFYRLGTPGGRNEASDWNRWLDAVERVVERNLQTLAVGGQKPTPAQCETLMRVFESVYRRAIKHGNPAAGQKALESANRWLKRCPASPASLRLRKIFGIPTVTRLTFSPARRGSIMSDSKRGC
jgi:glycosyltransferase involved in cell wall biosynthesis